MGSVARRACGERRHDREHRATATWALGRAPSRRGEVGQPLLAEKLQQRSDRAAILHAMRRLGHLLMGLGALVGVLVALASAGQLVVVGTSWLVRVALVKLAIVAAIALLAGGA